MSLNSSNNNNNNNRSFSRSCERCCSNTFSHRSIILCLAAESEIIPLAQRRNRLSGSVRLVQRET